MGIASGNIDAFITDLLRIDDDIKNRLVDLEGDGTFYLSRAGEGFGAYLLNIIKKRFGKTGNTVMRGSALSGSEQIVGVDSNVVDWTDARGERNPAVLDKFIKNAYGEIDFKGINPLFLCVGALRWKAPVGAVVREIRTPVLLFPVRLVRSVSSSPVAIEFVDDDIYFNPCLSAKLKRVLGDEVLNGFPHPNGENADKDDPVDLSLLGDGRAYFDRVEEFLEKCRAADENATFHLERDAAAVSRFNHDEICMYYDIRRNRGRIDSHPLIGRIFGEEIPLAECPRGKEPRFVLPKDSVQEEMIRAVINGQSLIVKGPPGTGKTLTIANMVAALIAEGKKVLLSSEKLSALSEVYAKLPEELRRFTMLLDCETASQAAKLNPSDVKRELSSILRAEVKEDGYRAFDAAQIGMSAAAEEAEEYCRIVYGGRVAGVSYYEAIDRMCKNDLPVISFTEKEEALLLSREEYEDLSRRVAEAGEYFDVLTRGGTFAMEKCPWFPVYGTLSGKDAEEAITRYQAIAPKAERAVKEGEALCEGNADALPVQAVVHLAESGLSEEEVQKSTEIDGNGAKAIAAALRDFGRSSREVLKSYEKIEGAAAILEALETCSSDERATLADLKILSDHCETLGRLATGEKEFAALAAGYLKSQREAETEKEGYLAVFRENLSAAELDEIDAAYRRFVKYGAEDAKPRAFDFGGKRAYQKLKAYSYLSDVGFSEMRAAVSKLHGYREKQGKLRSDEALLNRLFRKELGAEEVQAALAFGRMLGCEGADKERMLSAAERDYPVVREACRVAARKRGESTLSELRAVLAARIAQERLTALLADAGVGTEDCERTARGVLAARVLFEKTEDPAFLARVLQYDTAGLKELIRDFCAFSKECFPTYYGECADKTTYGDLKIFTAQATDRNVAGAAFKYFSVKESNAFFERFFRPFEQGACERGGASFCDWFEHSAYSLAVSAWQTLIGEKRNGLGKSVTRALEKFSAAEVEAANANASIIARNCLARIRKDDPDFAFLEAERSGAETLRKTFKAHGSAILKLKRCFLLSPSTVSVLFRGEEFSDFDVVIVDEASQLEPTGILPVLFRAKQCVLVGDEWQMPPIKHFVTRTERRIEGEDGEETLVDPDASVLGLALAHEAFPVRRLDCHYRSKTEALIAFSQARYYPDMQTFPAPVPFAEGLGFTDIYTPDGYSDGAVNEREAEESVNWIRRHFEKYYDGAEGILRESFGVIAFGEKQLARIKALFEGDAELSKKLKTALEHFDDVPEKLAFFRTIESAQGRETQHVALSLTYGRNKNGAIVQTFGEMNRGKLGQCIFNVAVTRAQSSVTVIHSVRAGDIDNENVSYIRDYLEYVEKFSEGGKGQFVSEAPDKGFLRAVGEYIVSCGVDRERVVYGYGVTKGSVRIPVAVLSEDSNRALLGVWCETAPDGKHYFDRNVRRYESLRERGWKLIRVYAHDWADNNKPERDAILTALKECGAV